MGSTSSLPRPAISAHRESSLWGCAHHCSVSSLKSIIPTTRFLNAFQQTGQIIARCLQGNVTEFKAPWLSSDLLICKTSRPRLRPRDQLCVGDCPWMEVIAYEYIQAHLQRRIPRHILRYYGFLFHSDTLYVIVEKASQGDLHSLLKHRQKAASRAFILACLRDLAGAVAFLHNMGIAHLDISLENIFVCTGDVLKLGDLASARVFVPGKTYKGWFGKTKLMAPEVMRNQDFFPAAADVYSLGVVFSILLTGKTPRCPQMTEIVINQYQGDDLGLKSLILSMVAPEQKRCSIQEVVNILDKIKC